MSFDGAADWWDVPARPQSRPTGPVIMAIVVALVALVVSDLALVVARSGKDHKPAAVRASEFGPPPTAPTAPPTTGARAPAPDLAPLLIAAPQGYVEVSGGINGDIGPDQLASFANMGLDLTKLPGDKLSSRDVANLRGFGHTWANQARGRVLVVLILELPNPAQADLAAVGAREAFKELPGATAFPTPDVPGSSGASFDQPAAGVGTIHVRGLFFTKGSRLVVVDLGGLRDVPAAEEAIALAKQQYDKL